MIKQGQASQVHKANKDGITSKGRWVRRDALEAKHAQALQHTQAELANELATMQKASEEHMKSLQSELEHSWVTVTTCENA